MLHEQLKFYYFVYIQLAFLKGVLVEKASNMNDFWQTITWKWVTKMGGVRLCSALPSEMSLPESWTNANSVLYPLWVSEDKYIIIWNVMSCRVWEYELCNYLSNVICTFIYVTFYKYNLLVLKEVFLSDIFCLWNLIQMTCYKEILGF